VVGSQADVYYNVPMGQTNSNTQTGFEQNVIAYGAGTSDSAAGFEGGASNTGTGTVTNLAGFYATGFGNSGGGTVHNVYGFWGGNAGAGTLGDTLNVAFFAGAQTAGANNYAFYNAADKARFGTLSALTYSSVTNCADSAGAAACTAAPAGSFVVDAGATSTVVSTTAVTANSEIVVTYDSSLGTRLSVTCNTTAEIPSVTARSASTSFTVTIPVAPTTNPLCLSYNILN
jgi:hypothetical protein